MAGSNVPETRQQMINLMYLVLTALLALNVTREVLNAFNTMNKSITRSNASINNKNDQIYQQLAKAMTTADSTKVRPWQERALAVKAKTNSLVNFVELWKDSLVSISGGLELSETGDSIVKGMDNINTAYNLFVTRKHGAELRDSMKAYIDFALNQIDSAAVKNNMADQFPLQVKDLPKTEENPSGDWAYGTFHNIPVIAGIAMLSKFQNDIKNSESMMLEYFQKQIYLKDYKFNALKAIAVPNTTYALAGQSIKATIMLAAYNKDAQGMTITSTAGNVPVKDGVGEMEFKASGVGTKTVNGKIFIEKNGQRESYDYKFDYTVGTAGGSLQLDKMNVMYIGVDNPITLAASGYNIEDVSVAWGAGSGVKMKPSGEKGHYLVEVSKQGTVDYKIMAKTREGGQTQIAGGQVRVKRIPDPIAKLGSHATGLLKTGVAKAQRGVIAALDGFDFDAKFQVLGFQFMWAPQNGQPLASPNDGPVWNQTVQQYIDRSKPGDKWVISNIKAKGPDNTVRTLSGAIVISLN